MFQTKSMPDRSMATYEITPDGMLVRRKATREKLDETESASVPSSLEYVAGKPLPVHGELEIYSSADRADGRKYWYSYHLTFRDGRVADVQRAADCGQLLPLPELEPKT